MKKDGWPPGRGRAVLSFAGRARSAGGDGGLRALSLVRALVGRVEVRAVVGGCRQNPGQRSTAAEDGPAGRGTLADADARIVFRRSGCRAWRRGTCGSCWCIVTSK